jgi:hypothetical protein
MSYGGLKIKHPLSETKTVLHLNEMKNLINFDEINNNSLSFCSDMCQISPNLRFLCFFLVDAARISTPTFDFFLSLRKRRRRRR